jgi:dipeptidyl-peptidase-4
LEPPAAAGLGSIICYLSFMRKTALFLCLLCVKLLSAQDKLLTMEEAFAQKNVTVPQSLRSLQFLWGSNDYVYLKREGGEEFWVSGGPKMPERSFLTLPELNRCLVAGGFDSVRSMPPIQFNKSAQWIVYTEAGKLAIDPVSGAVRTLIPKRLLGAAVVEESGSGCIAWVDKDNLYVGDGRKARQLTQDGSRNIVYATSVHRDEFGISKGTFWSPDGKTLAFYRMDQSMVTDYPLINWKERPAKVELIKYPMAGDKSHIVTIGVYNAPTERLVFLNTGAPSDQYLTNITWSPDSRSIYVAVLNRAQDHMWLNQYDAATGVLLRTLFEERDARYVEPLVPVLFVKGAPGRFIWQSNRDGWNHLYLYDTTGRMLRQLTQGPWEVVDVKGFDNNGSALYYSATTLSPLARSTYRLDLKTGASRLLTPGLAVHNTQVSGSGAYLLDSWSDSAHPRSITLVEAASTKRQELFAAPDPLSGYAKGAIRISTITAKDGSTIYTRTFLPVGFDSSRKYPVLVCWYGGPHEQLITAAFGGGVRDYWFYYMAGRGYIVFTLDPRGSDNRGRAFEQAIYRRTGTPQLEDLESGVAYLEGLPYADRTRMGLFGWSYGGFLTINFLLQHPGVFKAGVAGGPITDFREYEIMWGERYMDEPQENPEGYRAADLNAQAGKLRDHLLLIHGLQDDVVLQQHSVRFVRAAIDQGVQVDYMIYPGHAHNVGGKDRVHLYQKVTDYFEQFLK